MKGLSIVTVCMNRREHLLATAPRVAVWPHHGEHLIVDWSSRDPLRREELPGDERVRLLRVEGEGRWNLCRAYNFAVAHANGDLVLKLDADAWPMDAFDPLSTALRLSGGGRCARLGVVRRDERANF
ncbi:MAG: glycosyltransferase family 2 protein [Cyanobium sp.]